jgi:hypothetical protein
MLSSEARGGPRRSSWLDWVVPALVFGLYVFWAIKPSYLNPHYQNSYDLIVDAWMKGQLNLDVPIAGPFMKDPYNFAAHVDYILSKGIIDLSYFEEKLYSYFGIAPAALLYLPYRIVTFGQTLPDKAAVLLFCSGGFAFAAAFLLEARRRLFPSAPAFAVHASLAVLGLANLAPVLIRLSNVYEVAMSAAYFFFMAALYFFETAFPEDRVRFRRLTLASLCCGLAAASRPHFALAALPCLALAALRAGRRTDGEARSAAFRRLLYPFAACLTILALHNFLRFGDPFEFGASYYIMPLNPMGMGVLFDPARFFLGVYLYLFQTPLIGAEPPFVRLLREYPHPFFRWPSGTYIIDTGAAGLFPMVPFTLTLLFGPLLLWVSRARGIAAYLGRQSPFRAALLDTFFLYLGLFLAGRFIAPLRARPVFSEAGFFIDRAAEELPLVLCFAGFLSARLFAASRSREASPSFPRFEGALLAAPFLVLLTVAALHQNVNLRYPTDFASLAILGCAILWFHCDAALRSARGPRWVLGGIVLILGVVSVSFGVLRAMSVK